MQDNEYGQRRMAMDAMVNTNNLFYGKDFRSYTHQTIESIDDALMCVCGPRAKYVMRSSIGHNEIGVPMFSTDGINLIQAMDFLNPVQKMIANTVAYVGRRVESRAKDGTTTAMLMMSSAIYAALELNTLCHLGENYANPTQTIKRVMEQIKTDLMRHPSVMTPEAIQALPQFNHMTLEEIRGFVAYMIAMVASKNDDVLSTCVRDAIQKRPKELLNIIGMRHAGVETEKTFFLETIDAQFAPMTSYQSNPRYLNKELGTEYHNGDCDLLACSEELVPGGAVYTALDTYLANHTLERDLVILTNELKGSLTSLTSAYNNTHEKKCLVFLTADQERTFKTLNVIDIINASAAIEHRYVPPDTPLEELIHHQVQCIWRRGVLEIDKIYDCPKEAIYNPRFENKDNSAFLQLMHQISDKLVREKASHRPNAALISQLTDVYASGVSNRVPDILVIGGKTTEATANREVVADVLGSVLSSINDGVVIDGLSTLAEVLAAVKNKTTFFPATEFIVKLENRLKEIQALIFDGLLSGSTPESPTPPPTRQSYDQMNIVECFVDEEGYERYRAALGVTFAPDNKMVLIQPLSGYLEMIDRISEMASSIARTEIVQLRGAVTQDKEKA